MSLPLRPAACSHASEDSCRRCDLDFQAREVLGLVDASAHDCGDGAEMESDVSASQVSLSLAGSVYLGVRSRALLLMRMAAGVPDAVAQCTEALVTRPTFGFEASYEDTDFVELFAGSREVTKAFWKTGYRAVPVEKRDSDGPGYDVITPAGQLLVLQLLLRVKLGAGLLAAPVCSSWIWLTRNTT